MEILFALLVGSTSLLLAIVLPVVALLRASRAASELTALRGRIAAIEEHLRQLAVSSGGSTVISADRPHAPAVPSGAEAPPAPPVDHGVWPAPEPAGARDEAMLAPPVAADGSEPIAPPPTGEFAPGDSTSPAGPHPVSDAESEGDATALEEAIGGRLLLYAGTVVLVLGAAFFLKYAFDREWVTESMRVVAGGVAGMALVAGGLRIGRSGYTTYGQVLTGGGLAVLYLSVYAAFGFYGLIGSMTAFLLLSLVTAGAAVLADGQDSQPMAVMAIGGGFLTPFLVGGKTDAQITLFSYVVLLVIGTLHLGRRRQWPLLNVFSYALTIVTVAAWADAYYTRSKYLRTEIFLTIFCALFIAALLQARRLGTRRAQLVAVVLASAPILYHAVSIGILSAHGVAFLVYLIAFTVVSVGWATRRTRPEVRVLLWMAAVMPLLGWIDLHPSRNWIAPSLATLGAVFALHLLAQIDHLTRPQPDGAHVDMLLLHLNGLGLFLGVYELLYRQDLWWVPVIGLVLVTLHAGLAWWLRRRHASAALHALAVSFALLAAAVGVKFDGAWLTAAWGAEGAAVIWIGLRAERDWFRAAGAGLLAAAAGRWLVLSVLPPVPANFRLFVNEPTALGVWIIVLCYALAWLHRVHRSAAHTYARTIAALLVAASVATVVLLTAQNQAYWEIEGASNADATFAGQLGLSLMWALYAGVLIAIGIRRGYRPIRYAAIVLFAITVLKVFVADLSGLQGIYRVLGLVAVGTILLLASFLYQRRKNG